MACQWRRVPARQRVRWTVKEEAMRFSRITARTVRMACAAALAAAAGSALALDKSGLGLRCCRRCAGGTGQLGAGHAGAARPGYQRGDWGRPGRAKPRGQRHHYENQDPAARHQGSQVHRHSCEDAAGRG
ncbi:exported protein of unknown function (plasmid) [Cupriavidus neocaledonicus]|uniref:Uncharacterized protein n=1 Tax=Cupriavidus neocaledonicus TaxID=1040979 RepID=A0A375HKK3_9BURK|nr:exported protein of unknown function [Cupriavidus neocaledonicus]